MALWNVEGMSSPPADGTDWICDTGYLPAQFVLKDLDSGQQAVWYMCVLPTDTDGCTYLSQLTSADFTPNTWDAGCE